ncbi:2-oxo acid dehydrogenase subunit E2 [Mycobacterium sp.]|uniref:2-oxo acid dehydrogenase subunit E2 n=1 Tax=Mycobacterium sp. TaxID=1785 RepID=UPI002BFC85E1|nr:2-oxo acid dehydrogenase subunit E2 [Mycobacterium sp.]HTY31581.1 2-oxo acid dehydrogenase subunit E2 [Mycobacterium sp.]
MTKTTTPIPTPVWRKIAMATWRPGKDPTISATMDIEAPRLLEYIDKVREATGQHVTPAHLVGRAIGKVLEELPELNGRVVFGSFLPSPTIDCSFVVSLRTDPTTGAEAAATDISGTVVRRVNEKPPWVIARELADHVARIRHNDDPLFKQIKGVVKWLPPLALRPVAQGIGFVTDVLQLPLPLLGLEARPFGSVGITNIGTYGLETAFAPMPTFVHLPIVIIVGAVNDKVLARNGKPVVRPVLPLAIELDHRFVDGYQAAAMARIFRAYLADPAAFDPVPTSTPPGKRRRASTRTKAVSPLSGNGAEPSGL